ncbi:MAG: DNA polymerase III subunit alpha [Crocinitomicaceae bacterium]|nr:DNA polymerase III subunit alpha [Crocinitomicaceae bacterium]
MYLIFDTETTGLPKDFKAPITDTDNWPRVIQLAWQLHDNTGKLIEHKDFLIKPDGFNIPIASEDIHGISTELASQQGESISDVIASFSEILSRAQFIVGQNVIFDINVLGSEYIRLKKDSPLVSFPVLDTCTEKTAQLCKLPGGRGGKFKKPTLSELHNHLFGKKFNEAHNATADVEATTRCFLELIRLGNFSAQELQMTSDQLQSFMKLNSEIVEAVGLSHKNLKAASEKIRKKALKKSPIKTRVIDKKIDLKNIDYSHLHVFSQFSVLQSTIHLEKLVNRVGELQMPAVALTDSANMMAAFRFEKTVSNYNKKIKEHNQQEGNELKKEILPILGCTFNVCQDRLNKKRKDNGSQVVFLAKNKKGYQNLIKLSSIAYTEGFYYVPRVDKSVIQDYKNDLIVLSGNLQGEIPQLILQVGENQAEESLLWWKSQFGDDFYMEINRHGLEVENRVNETLLNFADKHEVKLVASNTVYYLNKKDSTSHDVLLCVRDNQSVSKPIGKGRDFRYGLENDSYYLKSPDEMKQLFSDIPEAIFNISEIIEKCEYYPLQREVLLPNFDIPDKFKDKKDNQDAGKRGENNYLKHLTYEGAQKRYGNLTPEVKDRIDFELKTIENTGYPGYFLIVQDFCFAARKMGVSVGPGRGSAAGSVVAYCNWITNIDPIKYDLLFERFLNPDRISMPDIDIDFDDEGRAKVIDYVIEKYGANQVAQIITYGTMAAKSSIKDAARVMDLPLPDAVRLANLVPSISLNKIFNLSEKELSEKLQNKEELNNAKELRKIKDSNSGISSAVLQKALDIEGSVRNTGIHACGVIITPDDITNYVPVALAKDSEMYCTQYDNSVAEDAGLLKMDFLGLKTLTLIKDAVKYVEETHGIKLDPDAFPLDDEKTYSLFQKGETVGIFQYESQGMQKYMRDLKPTEFADLIAMAALYRPGPMDYIPLFVRRKHGEEEIVYDLEDCEEYLKETYGITVYQEQVMLLSQKIAGFTKGQADTLRKAMGKKDRATLDKMKPQFLKGAIKKNHPVDVLEKIWKDWEAFASYAFNKSHATCYAWIAYQTAYLKANYPSEYFASVLSNNMNDIKKVTLFMEESRRMGLAVLGPDVNESKYTFAVNKKGEIRFGLGAILGLGSAPVEAIVSDRIKNGNYHSVFDLAKRINLRVCNTTSFKNLTYAGAFDSFKNCHRSQFFVEDIQGRSFLDKVLSFGARFQQEQNSSQVSMFGDQTEVSLPEPEYPEAEPWNSLTKLTKEKEVVGVFISGHPLDDFKYEIKAFCNANVSMLSKPNEVGRKELIVAAIVSNAEERLSRRGDKYGVLHMEDYNDTHKLFLFGETYLRYQHFLSTGAFICVRGVFQKSRYNDRMEFRVNSIELLNQLAEKRIKNIKLHLFNADLNQIYIQEINKVLKENNGDCELKITVQDLKENIDIKLHSRSIRVKPSKKLFKSLENLDVKFTLN